MTVKQETKLYFARSRSNGGLGDFFNKEISMERYCCDEWEPGIKALNDIILLKFARSGVDAYKGEPFKFCPWCGQGRDDIPADIPSLAEMRELLSPNVKARGCAHYEILTKE